MEHFIRLSDIVIDWHKY